MKNFFCLFEGHFEAQGSCASLFEVSFFVSELLTFFCCADWIGDDIVGFAAEGW